MDLNEIRCQNCGRLFFKMEYGLIQIKCPRCGVFNLIEFYQKPGVSNIQKIDLIDTKIKKQKIDVKICD